MSCEDKIFVISGASGAGKDTVTRILAERYQNISVSPSVTTREQRAGDNQPGGKIYTYVSIEEFKKMIAQELLFEYSMVNEQYYGTPKNEANNLIEQGINVIMILDVDGGLNLKESFPDTVLIFLKAPSIEVLRERLINRRSNTPEEIENRLQRVDYENEMGKRYDYIVINDILDDTLKEVADIILNNKML